MNEARADQQKKEKEKEKQIGGEKEKENEKGKERGKGGRSEARRSKVVARRSSAVQGKAKGKERVSEVIKVGSNR